MEIAVWKPAEAMLVIAKWVLFALVRFELSPMVSALIPDNVATDISAVDLFAYCLQMILMANIVGARRPMMVHVKIIA